MVQEQSKLRKFLLILLNLLVVSGILTVFSNFLGVAYYNLTIFKTFLMHPYLWVVNTIPVFCLALIIYAITRRFYWTTLITAVPTILVGLVNFYMLKYRNSPLQWADLKLAKEAGNMGTRYSYVPPKFFWIFLVIIIAIIVVQFIFFRKPPLKLRWWVRVAMIILSAAALIGTVYFSDSTKNYERVAVTGGDVWNDTNRYATNGVIFAFEHSIHEGEIKKPSGYTEAKAKAILNRYTTTKVPSSKKINIIEIQLEAYQDFRKFTKFVDPSVYADLDKVKAKSASGELYTSVFAGGTVDTERKILTGYSPLPPINGDMTSLVDYYKDDDYIATKAHPGYGWFYNRQNIDKYLGFTQFLDKEDYYNKHVSKKFIVPDSLVFKDLEKRFEKKPANKYWFNQTVTYQNHGPYAKTFKGTKLLHPNYYINASDQAILNNYLTGIKKTNAALLQLVNYFEKQKQPVIIEFHGDHNPWGGDNTSGYGTLNVDFDLNTAVGHANYYSTPEVVYANPAAQKRMKKTLKGKTLQTVSPNYVIPQIMSYQGNYGSKYIKYLNHLRKTISVVNDDGSIVYKGKYYRKVPKQAKHKMKEYKMVQYYLETQK